MDEDNLAESLVYSGSEDEELSPPTLNNENDKEINETLAETGDGILSKLQCSDEDDNENEEIHVRKTKKTKKILSSDEENEDYASKADEGDKSSASEPVKVVRPTICDSESSDQAETKEPSSTKEKKKNKVLTKKRSKKQKNASKVSGNDSKSGSNSSSDGGNSSSNSGAGSDSEDCETPSSEHPIKQRDKKPQRKSAKAAEDTIKEIQSESQRIARGIYVNVPYHKPKQYSLQEFLNRRSLSSASHTTKSTTAGKAAAAIKMSEEDLIEYARKLEDRAQEAIEFFRSEDEDEEEIENEDNPKSPEKSEVQKALNEEYSTEIVTDCSVGEEMTESFAQSVEELENVESNIAPAIAAEKILNEAQLMPSTSAETKENQHIELHTTASDLDLELDQMIAEDRKKSSIAKILALSNISAPKLHGQKDMVIDLETNEIMPREKLGVEELKERFIKHVIPKVQPENLQNELSIFSPDLGRMEKLNHSTEVMRIDLKPGQAYFKLKEELSKKIHEKRCETLSKRIEDEIQKKKEMESDEEMILDDDDDEEEADDDEEVAEDEESEKGKAMEFAETEAGVDDENDEEKVDEEEEEVEENDNEDSDFEDEENEVVDDQSKPKRSRIIAAFEDDSDDEEKSKENASAGTFLAPEIQKNVVIKPTQANDSMNYSETLDEFESHLFDVSTQSATNDQNQSISRQNSLFQTQNDNDEISESQLIDLCSGVFATQLPVSTLAPPDVETTINEVHPKMMGNKVDEVEVDVRAALSSSDDEEKEAEGVDRKKRKKLKQKQKRKTKHKKLEFSDEESQDEEENVDEEAEYEEEIEDEEVEKYIEYDSDENEIEVALAKKEVRKKASEYFENEAELSESEWGSADEDEKNLDVFEGELGDEDEFDQAKLQTELERIQLKQQIDQDAREVRILKEMFIEEEEDGETRQRKFRWKNVDNSGFDLANAENGNENNGTANSDEENEEEWRRLRYEREQLLLKQATEVNMSIELVEKTIAEKQSKVTSIRKTTFIKSSANETPKPQSPFLLGGGALNGTILAGRKSFLNRDTRTLEKLATLTKVGADGEAIAKTTAGKGNYVFVATEKKDNNKRRSEDCDEIENPEENARKKVKVTKASKRPTQKPKGFLELLSK